MAFFRQTPSSSKVGPRLDLAVSARVGRCHRYPPCVLSINARREQGSQRIVTPQAVFDPVGRVSRVPFSSPGSFLATFIHHAPYPMHSESHVSRTRKPGTTDHAVGCS